MKDSPCRVGTRGTRSLPKDWVPASVPRDPNLAKAELVAAGGRNPPAKGLGHELGAETHAENRHAGCHGTDQVSTFREQRGIAVVCRQRTAKGDDEVDLFQGRRIELVEVGRAFENVEGAELESAFEKGRGVVLGQGLGLGVANYQCELLHLEYRSSLGVGVRDPDPCVGADRLDPLGQ